MKLALLISCGFVIMLYFEIKKDLFSLNCITKMRAAEQKELKSLAKKG